MKKLEKYAQTRLKTELEIIRRSPISNLLPELSLEEKAIIYKYTDNGHFVNETLRESKGKKIPEFAHHLTNVLSKLQSSNLVVYSGLKYSASTLNSYKQALENGTRLMEFGFVSASIRRSSATQFGTIIFKNIIKKRETY